jgi:insecticidal toxin complex protein TccC
VAVELVAGLVWGLRVVFAWYYNNTLNKLTKANKSNTIQYYVYNYQDKRVRTVIESSHQVQSQRDYLPSLDLW